MIKTSVFCASWWRNKTFYLSVIHWSINIKTLYHMQNHLRCCFQKCVNVYFTMYAMQKEHCTTLMWIKRFKDPLSSGNMQLESQSHLSLWKDCVSVSLDVYILISLVHRSFVLHCPRCLRRTCLFFNTVAFFQLYT